MMISALVGAGASLLGGAMARSSQREANSIAQSQYNQNVALQREFAQNGIRWRVEDAKAAGLHPLYALNQSGASYTPQATVSHSPLDYSDISGAGGYLSQGLGQSITRARESKQSYAERAIEELRAEQQYQYTTQMQGLQLENQKLQNVALQTEIAQMAQASRMAVANTALPPAMPSASARSDGQFDTQGYFGDPVAMYAPVIDEKGGTVGFTFNQQYADSLEDLDLLKYLKTLGMGLTGIAGRITGRPVFGYYYHDDGYLYPYPQSSDGPYLKGRIDRR